MDNELTLAIVSLLPCIPTVIACFLPVHNQLKCSGLAAFVRFGLGLAICIPVAAWVKVNYGLELNALALPLVLLFFVVFHLHLKVSLACTTAIVSLVCALMSIMANYANAYDAMIRPDAAPGTFSMEAALFQLAISTALVVILGWFLWNFGAELVDQLGSSGIWTTTTIVSLVFVTLNVALYPTDYATIQERSDFITFLMELSLLLVLLLMSAGMFYFTVSEILDKHRMEERNRMLEIQESQYQSQRSYLEATTRMRHDFRQTIRTLKTLSEEGEYEKLDEYLSDYIDEMPQNTAAAYCQNNAVNALLNYYARTASANGVDLNLSVELEENLPISDVDLCSMVGNILENAMTAAKGAPEGMRWIDLVVTAQYDSQLLIVESNGMAGNIKMRNGEYLSTSHRGAGIGLSSIQSVAKRHGGIAEFSHTENEFHTDVMIPLH